MSRYNNWGQWSAIHDIDARLSALEAAQNPTDCPPAPDKPREPGWYWVMWYPFGDWGFGHWTGSGFWSTPGSVDTHGNQTGQSSIQRIGQPFKIGPRIQEPGE